MLVRLRSGNVVAKGIDKCARPTQPLILYDSEPEPECRLVRETLSVLDLDYVCYPCPKETLTGETKPLNSRFRAQLLQVGGLIRVPLLVDPSKDVKIYDAVEINNYLWKEYGNRATMPSNYRLAQNQAYCRVALFMCQLLRPCMSMGILRAPSHRPAKPLELWGCESSPFVRRVREVLATLEIPYVMHTVAAGSSKREAFRKDELDKIPSFRSMAPGKIQMPMLRDPNNNDLRLLESADIVKYLTTKYQTYMVGSESWLDASGTGSEFSHSTAGAAAVLGIFAPPVLALTYAVVALFV